MKEKIPHRSTHCLLGGELLSPGSSYISALLSTSNGWKRKDYCLDCWSIEKDKDHGPFWQGKIPIKQEKTCSSDQKAVELFQTSKDLKLLTILALYLIRCEEIVKRSETKTNVYYEILESGEIITVEKIMLSAMEVKEMAETLLV